jgi:glycerol-3-phosphate dehydrogenase
MSNNLRSTNLEKLQADTFDAVIIGAGINGAVSAAALAARGAHVALIDRNDFSGLTSMNSSNLAWGGIKYLESGEVGLVRKLCKSRNHLIEAFPSTVQEIRFLTTVERGFRKPVWLLYLGTLIYWVVGGFFTRGPRLLSPKKLGRKVPVVDADKARGGFEYSDARLHDNDSRFVFGFVRQAITYGCIAANYVSSLGAERDRNGLWNISARDEMSGEEFTIRSLVVINACGPYVDHHNELTGEETAHQHLFSKGIHLIVDRIEEKERVLTFFADDGRPFFSIPMGSRSVIGTTDTRVPTPEAVVTDEDRQFVLDNINKRLRLEKPLTRDDIVAERCGVRPLALEKGGSVAEGDWTRLSRKHAIDVSIETRHLSIFGGKLTDCVNVGNEVCEYVGRLGVVLPYPDHRWYGEPHEAIHQEYLHQAQLLGLDELTSPHASEPLSQRLWRRYGTRAIGICEDIRRDPAMAEVLIETSEYIRAEIYRTAKHEMVVRLEDFLRRRSKISQVVRREDLRRSEGLREACRILFGDKAQQRWEEYFGERWQEEPEAPGINAN